MDRESIEFDGSEEMTEREKEIQDDLESGYDPWEDDRLIITSELVHKENIPPSIRVHEDFFTDGRSYLSELWCEDQITLVTYYFPVDEPPLGEIPNDKKFIEDYLIAQGKLIRGEEHHLGIGILDCDGGYVYSVSVAVGDDDETFCEAYM